MSKKTKSKKPKKLTPEEMAKVVALIAQVIADSKLTKDNFYEKKKK